MRRLGPALVAVGLLLLVPLVPASQVSAQAIDQNLWVTDGQVNAVVRNGGTIYIGGAFTQVGPATGGAVPLSAATGSPLGLPKVAGVVNAVAPDGSGGWYVGGTFTHVGGVPRSNIAHIRADNTVSPWDPNANSVVNALVVSGGTVYAGGFFTSIGGQARSKIAALDTATGLATAWNPSAISGSTVSALAVSGGTVYAGGDFTSIGGQTRNRIAALDAATGLATTWNPNASSAVYALALSGSTLYVGGAFATVGGQARSRIAALSAATGLASAWNPNANGDVVALAVSAGTVYAGGAFTTIGGQTRNHIAALDGTSGVATAWNPNADAGVNVLTTSGTSVYAGGLFTLIGAQPRNHIAALDPASGLATSWDPNANGAVFALAASGGTVFAGGEFTSLGGQPRINIAALDASTGVPTAWDPKADSPVNALALSGATIYAGGDFTIVGGQTRIRIAALDTSGAATAWNPNASNTVYALAVSGGTVYAGGTFTIIGGQTRNAIAALDATTGLATAWNPNANSTVFALAVNGGTVYAGGDFTTIGGQARVRIAALSAGSGLATAWNPNANAAVEVVVVSGSTVYTGGVFTTIGGQTRSRIAALDATTGLATAWNPNASGGSGGTVVKALAVSGPLVYAGGEFTTIGGQTRNSIAALDGASGLAGSWDPSANVNSTVYALAVSGTTIHAGGGFTSLRGLPRAGIASIAASPALSAIVPSSGGNTGQVSAILSGSGLPGGCTVRLTRSGLPDIVGTSVVAADGTSLGVTFNLAGADTGLWSVEVTTPDAQTASLAGGFTITGVSAAQLRVSIIGLAQVLGLPSVARDHRTPLDLVIHNDGNVDALDVPLWVTGIPLDATVALDFTLSYPPQSGGEPAWSGVTVPLTFTSAGGKYLTLVIPRVPPGATTRRIFVTVPGPTHPPFTLSAAVTPPWVDGAVFRSCLAGGGITNPSCMGTQLTATNAYLAANPALAAMSGMAIWAKEAFDCEPGANTLANALAKSEQVLDYLGTGVEQGSASIGCENVVLPRWREVETVSVVGAVDPNDKLGQTGTVSGQQAMSYSIRFENVGTVPAQDVIVDDPLDATKLDLSSVSLDAITFGNVRLSPPGGQNYSGTVYLAAQNLRVDVAAQLDPLTHHLTWYFNSYDATTGAPPPLGVGFLPVNDATHAGEGSVLFNVRPKAGLTGTVANAASITFDDPPATNTQAWENSVDTAPPASHVLTMPTNQSAIDFTVQWAPDSSPDVRDYTIYASENGGPYWPWRVNTVALSDTFESRNGFSYRFYSRARDQSGNIEATPALADAQTTAHVVGVEPGAPWRLALAGARPNPARAALQVWFTLESAESATLELFDVAGRRVARRAVGALGPGEHALTLAGAPELRAGLYFLRLSQGGRALHARAAVVR